MEMCRLNRFHNDLRVFTELQVISKTASRFWFYAYKKYKNSNSARLPVINVTSARSYAEAELTISVREYMEN